MSAMPYLIKHPSGVYYAQRKVPERLQTAVPKVLRNGKERLTYLKRSLGTKDKKQANISIKPVLIDFDRIIREAEALENSKPPVRTTLSPPSSHQEQRRSHALGTTQGPQEHESATAI